MNVVPALQPPFAPEVLVLPLDAVPGPMIEIPALVLGCRFCDARNRVLGHRIAERARCGRCRIPITPLAAPWVPPTADDFDALVRSSTVPLLVDFWAAWCSPCKHLSPELDRLAWLLAGRAVVVKINVDVFPEMALEHRVTSVPTLVLFRSGREVDRFLGVMTAETIARRMAQAMPS